MTEVLIQEGRLLHAEVGAAFDYLGDIAGVAVNDFSDAALLAMAPFGSGSKPSLQIEFVVSKVKNGKRNHIHYL